MLFVTLESSYLLPGAIRVLIFDDVGIPYEDVIYRNSLIDDRSVLISPDKE